MLLTDVWDLLEHMAENPPMHRLMQYVAPTFGYKPQQASKKSGKAKSVREAAKANSGIDFSAMGAKMLKMPEHSSPAMREIIAKMKGEAS